MDLIKAILLCLLYLFYKDYLSQTLLRQKKNCCIHNHLNNLSYFLIYLHLLSFKVEDEGCSPKQSLMSSLQQFSLVSYKSVSDTVYQFLGPPPTGGLTATDVPLCSVVFTLSAFPVQCVTGCGPEALLHTRTHTQERPVIDCLNENHHSYSSAGLFLSVLMQQ